jgi:hypothetical protein
MKLIDFVDEYGGDLLGIVQGTVAAIAGIGGLIPESHVKYWMAAAAILAVLQSRLLTMLSKQKPPNA